MRFMNWRMALLLGLLALPGLAVAETGDSGDSGDSGESGDSDEAPGYTLADRTKDEGGCGFGGSAAALLPGVLAFALTARERRR